MSEADIASILAKLLTHSSLCAYAYIFHDDEGKEPHFHILLAFDKPTTYSFVYSYFTGVKDSKGEFVNTLFQKCDMPFVFFKYLTHSDEKSALDVAEGKKKLYPETDIKGYKLDFFKNGLLEDVDSATTILFELMEGYDVLPLFKKYGRDFIFNYGRYRDILYDLGFEFTGRRFVKERNK